MKKRATICFPMPIGNIGRYQDWLRWLLEDYHEVNVRYNDFRYVLYGQSSRKLGSVFSESLSRMRALLSMLNADTVIFCNMYMDTRLFWIAVAMKKEIILDSYISIYQTNVFSRKLIEEGSKKAMKIYRREQAWYRHADKVIFLTEHEKNWYCRLLNAQPQHAYVLPLGNPERPRARLPYFHGISNKPCFCWWGGENNPLHGLPNIAAALAQLERQGQIFEFHILGCDPVLGDPYYSKILRDSGIHSHVEIHYLSEDLDAFLRFLSQRCDVGFGPLSLEEKAVAVVANKALDCLNMGIPLVTVESPSMRKFVDDSMVWFCEDVSPEHICERIQELLACPNVLHRVESARAAFLADRAPHVLRRRFMDIIHDGNTR